MPFLPVGCLPKRPMPAQRLLLDLGQSANPGAGEFEHGAELLLGEGGFLAGDAQRARAAIGLQFVAAVGGGLQSLNFQFAIFNFQFADLFTLLLPASRPGFLFVCASGWRLAGRPRLPGRRSLHR